MTKHKLIFIHTATQQRDVLLTSQQPALQHLEIEPSRNQSVTFIWALVTVQRWTSFSPASHPNQQTSHWDQTDTAANREEPTITCMLSSNKPISNWYLSTLNTKTQPSNNWSSDKTPLTNQVTNHLKLGELATMNQWASVCSPTNRKSLS